MRKRATLADVAKSANVSMMTVSRAINNKPGVSAELRQKILEIAAEMNYQPNRIARGLATRQMSTVGLVVPSISNPFYAEIAQSVGDTAFENGYNVFLINTHANLDREEAALDSLWAQHIDGAILCSLRRPEKMVIDSIERFPAVVLVNRELSKPLPNVVSINVNDQRAAQEAVQHFLEQGRRRIAYIGAPKNSFSSQRRQEGYRAALKSAKVAYDPALVIHIMPDMATGKEAAETLLSSHPDIDAILAFNDLVAVGALQACQIVGKKIPQDVAVIGADDIPLASLLIPRLTTSRVNLDYLGRLAMRTLLDIIAGNVSPASSMFDPELILRDSA
jgi:DNA-binding LacI/PurR family transcriptional regulator